MRAPQTSGRSRFAVWGRAWKRGRTLRMASPGPACKHPKTASIWAVRFSWVSITPMGSEVVPEVNRMAAVASDDAETGVKLPAPASRIESKHQSGWLGGGAELVGALGESRRTTGRG